MTLVDLLIGVGAASALVELLRHDKRLSDLRIWADTADSFWAYALACPFCASHWAGLLAAFILVGPYSYWPCWLTLLPYLIACGLAFTRFSNLLNDLTHGFCRSPSRPEDPDANSSTSV